jgi:hypothetical protein
MIYIGVHKETQVEDYWNTNIQAGPLHTIARYISLRRFEQVKRFLYISNVEEDIRQGRNKGQNDEWWYKLESLVLELQHLFVQFYSPSSEMSIDELIVQCFGQSIYTYKMPSKPISQGFKLYAIADHVYIYSFQWSSKTKGMQIRDAILHPTLTNTSCLVRSLALFLPRRRITIYIDNYFTSVPLFEELRACGFGAIRTTRPHSEFPVGIKGIKGPVLKEA